MSTLPLPPTHPAQPEEHLPPFDLSSAPDIELDVPTSFELIHTDRTGQPEGTLPLPPIILGCAPFGYGIYADTSSIVSSLPLRLVRLALRAGINAFDTAPHYHPSEIVLGNALHALRNEFPRNSYSIITKAGKYGTRISDHVYDPDVIRASVERSLKRLHTDYLDVVYLHDVEFVTSAPFPCAEGGHVSALTTDSEAFHLDPPHTSLGAGDDSVLACLAVLRDLQSQGKIGRVGLAGYPLPVLLRLSLLALHTAPFTPVDIVQTYAHETILTHSLSAGYLEALTVRAKVGQVVNAAPLAMGILTTSGGPEWHPARTMPRMYDATREATTLCKDRGTSIEDIACGFGYRELRQMDRKTVPVVIGCTTLEQLHLTLKSYAAVNGGEDEVQAEKRRAVEREVIELFEARGAINLSWQSPGPSAFQ